MRLRQHRLDGAADLRVALASRWNAGAGLHYTSFAQDEQSREDGNEFVRSSLGAGLRMSWSF